jgi:NSS family neurotransmitter:Na+ symporter
MKDSRPKFTTKFGVIAATVGSAVGLGNIWRFPYEAGSHGGGAFMITYLICVLLIGIPVVCAEFMMGRASRKNIFGAMPALASNHSNFWHCAGFLGVASAMLILSFYAVVAGWTFEYLFQSVTGSIVAAGDHNSHIEFVEFTAGWRCVFWTLILLAINTAVVLRGVKKGIEKVSNWLMPILFVLLIIMVVNSLLLPGATEGMKFLFNPDFSQLNSATLLSAIGQAFFSLSIGLGTLTVYGSYFPSSTKIVNSASTMALLDTLVAIMAGIIIFPAVFTFGMEPAAGPQLVFEVLPDIFRQMGGGVVWSVIFFLLLVIASLTSTISLSETGIAFCVEHWGVSRKKAVALSMGFVTLFGIIHALSFGPLADVKIFGMTTFDLFDFITADIFLPLGGMLISFFVGWIMDRQIVKAQLSPAPKFLCRLIIFSLRYISPVAILLVFINNLLG